MADDLSLLLKIRGDSAGATKAAADTRAAIASLRTGAVSEFTAMQAASRVALQGVSDSLSLVVGRVPLVGGIFATTTSGIRGLGAESKEQEPLITGVVSALANLSTASGKSIPALTGLISGFAKIESPARLSTESIKSFGYTIDLIGNKTPKFAAETEKATAAMRSLNAASVSTVGGLGVIGAAIAGLAVIAVGAVVVIVKLSSAIFDLAKSTADYAGKLFDLSKQTNFSVETLSALTLAAKTSGGSIDSISGSLGIFQANMVKAGEGNKEYAKTFRDLNIDTTDQEKALRQAMAALFAMGETEKQSAKAKELFGRAGKEVLGVIKETNGNLDEAIAKYREMNLLVSDEAAAAADQFSDSLDLLNEQFAGLGRTVGFSVIPVLTVFFEDMSKGLSGNKDEWLTWGNAVEALVAGVLGFVEAIPIAINQIGFALAGLGSADFSFLDAGFANQRSILDRAEATQAAQMAISAADRAMRQARGTGDGTGGGGKTAKDTRLRDALKDAALTERESLLLTAEDLANNKRQLDEQLIDITEFTQRALEIADARHDAEIVRINAEQVALDLALSRKLIKRQEYDQKDRELTAQNTEAFNKNTEERFRLEQERDKQIAAAEQAARERQLQIAEDADKRTIDRIESRIKQQFIAESEGERQIGDILDAGFARRRKALEEEDAAYQTSFERRAAITDELIRLDAERAASAEAAAARILAAELTKGDIEDIGSQGKAGFTPKVNATTGAIDQLFNAVNDRLTGNTQTAALAGLEAITGAFEGLGQAVGQAVAAFVLYGSAGQSVRQVTAQILASVAQQAAVKAIFELAEGFAALALAFFGIPNAGPSAQAHFAAAAIYGTIAGIAAIAGRVVAGDSFTKQQAGGSSSGGGGSSGGSQSGSSSPATQSVDRRNYVGARDVVEIRFTGQLGDVIEHHWVDRYTSGGRLRNTVINDKDSG